MVHHHLAYHPHRIQYCRYRPHNRNMRNQNHPKKNPHQISSSTTHLLPKLSLGLLYVSLHNHLRTVSCGHRKYIPLCTSGSLSAHRSSDDSPHGSHASFCQLWCHGASPNDVEFSWGWSFPPAPHRTCQKIFGVEFNHPVCPKVPPTSSPPSWGCKPPKKTPLKSTGKKLEISTHSHTKWTNKSPGVPYGNIASKQANGIRFATREKDEQIDLRGAGELGSAAPTRTRSGRWLPNTIWVFPKIRGATKWMVYNGKPY